VQSLCTCCSKATKASLAFSRQHPSLLSYIQHRLFPRELTGSFRADTCGAPPGGSVGGGDGGGVKQGGTPREGRISLAGGAELVLELLYATRVEELRVGRRLGPARAYMCGWQSGRCCAMTRPYVAALPTTPAAQHSHANMALRQGTRCLGFWVCYLNHRCHVHGLDV